MDTTTTTYHRSDLVRIATLAMKERGLEPEFPPGALQQLQALHGPGRDADPQIRDLTALPWCSIDNDDSRDLDQLTACAPLPGGAVKVLVAVADVDALVRKGSPLDAHAHTNTTSVYTSARVFPMLPERLSTDLTSLNPHQDRLAIVTEMEVDGEGAVAHSAVYRALVRNQAQLAYEAVAAWVEGAGELPEAARAVPGMDAQLRTQDAVAQAMRARRRAQGSLELETFQPRAVFEGDRVVDLRQPVHNRARQLIEEFMIATNTCTAQFLAHHGAAALRRVVRSPERWLRIVEVARRYGETLPQTPDSQALEAFLARQRKADPLRFPDLSLVIIKLMGSGEYVVEQPHGAPIGHFGLAVRDYAHSTAPNRRYPDLISLRMVKAMLSGERPPYSVAELEALAVHCTRQEDAAQKVERSVRKSEAALYLQPLMGQQFDAIVTGRTDSATWVRTLAPPAEGLLVAGEPLLDVGQRIRVKLVGTNVERGFIDFEQVRAP
ncbi:ribonuclease II [Acidovorax sp. SRB_14]|uniref:RNB domain-containing ribonuclease n=1 Tax=unclassified Acidovorax TaxID=2684926 RepID=UPI00145CEDC4|nr:MULTISPECIES: RNB domain-containing ribonuclease [unclassified Acidovorax]NMM75317.1 ribonuclease II [Acidovorax sp. SRB_24]NMM80824.1 ribonuclease II [Acidovorax sp. SRB_14]NMM85797.1 ribonuclease II [Rhodococcus sp. SRB_17]